MPVEFSCPRCQQRLRTPDGSQGKQTRCPNCAHPFEIPWLDPGRPALGPPLPTAEDTSWQDVENPFSAPATVSEVPVAADKEPLAHRQIFARDLLNWTWEIITTQLGRCLLLGLLMFAIYFAGYVVSFALSSLAGLLSGLGPNPQLQMVATVGLALGQFIWGQVYGAFLTAVSLRYALNLLRGQAEPMQGAFNILPLLLRVILVQLIIGLLAGVVVGVAAMLVAVPIAALVAVGQGHQLIPVLFAVTLVPLGILGWLYVWVRFSLALPLVVDRNLGVMQSLSESLRYSRGNVAAILGATVGVALLAGLFALVTFGIGIVLSMSAWVLFRGVVYLSVTGQQEATIPTSALHPVSDRFDQGVGASPFANGFGDPPPVDNPISPDAPLQ